jgi:hypothetical protein
MLSKKELQEKALSLLPNSPIRFSGDSIPANIINGTPTAFMVYNGTGKLVEQYKMFHFDCSTV